MDTIKFNSKQAKIIAHRGLGGIERENTYPAFVAAANRNYWGIEADVRITKDGEFVILHDETTLRVSEGISAVNVEKSDYSALSNIVLPDLDGTLSRQDIKIPLLTDYVKICKKYNKVCVIEIKGSFTGDNIKRMIKQIQEQDYIENAVFISFDLQNCIYVRNILPDNCVQWLVRTYITTETEKTLLKNRLDVAVYYHRLDKTDVIRLQSHGIKINCWTCDVKDDAEELVKMGVDFITTNILESIV